LFVDEYTIIMYNHDNANDNDNIIASTTTVLQADFATLRHMCDELEKAVAESRSTHSRRIIRYVK
jgi:hypothetical protein